MGNLPQNTCFQDVSEEDNDTPPYLTQNTQNSGETFVRRYADNPVNVLSLMGEISQQEAQAYYDKYADIRKALIALEGKKQCRRFSLLFVLGTLLLSGLVLVIILENQKLKNAEREPRTETMFKILEEYPIEFPVLVLYAPLIDEFDPIWEIASITEHFDNEKASDFHANLPNVETDLNFIQSNRSSQYCMQTLDAECIFCGLPTENLFCRSNSEKRLLCDNGMTSAPRSDPDFSWRFCANANSTRQLCPSTAPIMVNAKLCSGGEDYCCSTETADMFTMFAPNISSNLYICPDRSDAIQFPSRCTQQIIDIDKDDPFDISRLNSPGIYKICDSMCAVFVVPNLKVADHSKVKIMMFLVIHKLKNYLIQFNAIYLNDKAYEDRCGNKTFDCLRRYVGFGKSLIPNFNNILEIQNTIHETVDGIQRNEIKQSLKYNPADTFSNIISIEVNFIEPSILVREYVHYTFEDSFQTVAAFVTYYRVLAYFIILVFMTRFLPSNYLEYFPRFSEPVFSSRFREQLKFVMDHDSHLVGSPEKHQRKISLMHSLKTRFRVSQAHPPN